MAQFVLVDRLVSPLHLLATGSVDRTVRLWQLPGLQMLGEMRADAGAFISLTFARDGRTLVAGTQDGLGGRVEYRHTP